MDTGFRRYDGTWFNSSSHRLHIYFEGETKSVKLAKKKSETFVSAMKKIDIQGRSGRIWHEHSVIPAKAGIQTGKV